MQSKIGWLLVSIKYISTTITGLTYNNSTVHICITYRGRFYFGVNETLDIDYIFLTNWVWSIVGSTKNQELLIFDCGNRGGINRLLPRCQGIRSQWSIVSVHCVVFYVYLCRCISTLTALRMLRIYLFIIKLLERIHKGRCLYEVIPLHTSYMNTKQTQDNHIQFKITKTNLTQIQLRRQQ